MRKLFYVFFISLTLLPSILFGFIYTYPSVIDRKAISVEASSRLKIFSPLFCESPYLKVASKFEKPSIVELTSKKYKECWSPSLASFNKRNEAEGPPEAFQNVAFVFDQDVLTLRIYTVRHTTFMEFNPEYLEANSSKFSISTKGDYLKIYKRDDPLFDVKDFVVSSPMILGLGFKSPYEHAQYSIGRHLGMDKQSLEKTVSELKKIKLENLVPMVENLERTQFACLNQVIGKQTIRIKFGSETINIEAASLFCPSGEILRKELSN